jgi:osmotically-inducible protein OsmY
MDRPQSRRTQSTPACEIREPQQRTRLDFPIEAHVHCGEQECGHLWKVVVDPYTNRVTELIIVLGIVEDAYVVPVSAVRETTDEGIVLAITPSELERFPPYRERDFVDVAGFDLQEATGYTTDEAVKRVSPFGMIYPRPIHPMIRHEVHEGVSADMTVIERGTPVSNDEGTIGLVDHVLVDAETAELTHIVVDTGILAQSIVIPVDALRQINENDIVINLTNEELRELPRYTRRDQADIRAELEDQLQEADIGPAECLIELENGSLRLSGIVADGATRARAEAIARSIPGIVEVQNDLDTDTDIEARVLAALDELDLPSATINITSEQGTVTLQGQVPTDRLRQEVELVASIQNNVRQVINHLQVARSEFAPPTPPEVGR